MESNELRILLQAMVQRLDIIIKQNDAIISLSQEEVEDETEDEQEASEDHNEQRIATVKRKPAKE